MKRLSPSTWPVLIVTVALILTAVTFYLPTAASVSNALANHMRTALTVLISALYVGSAWAILGGLKSFKRELRIAYRLMALGVLSFSAVFIQLVFWSIFNIWDSAWAISGSGLFPFVITCIFMYTGVRKFARLLGVRSKFTFFLIVSGIAVVVSVLFGLAASQWVQYKLDGVEIYIAVCAICAGFLFFAGLLMYKIYRSIGSYYKVAMGWLAASMFGFTAASLHEAINTFWFNNGDTYTDYGYYLIPWVIVGAILVRASYAFRMLPLVPDTTAAESAAVQAATARDYIDSILNIVGLVSRPSEVETSLDELRYVTANMHSETELQPAAKQRLQKAYLQIEDHLLTKDPLRTFTKEEIRSHTTPAFQAELKKAGKS